MIDQIMQRENYALAKKLLDVSHARHEALSGNIANVETPGYQRRDIQANFAQELGRLAKSDRIDGIRAAEVRVEVDKHSPSVRSDGNNVQIDSELLELSKNAMQYEFLAQYTSTSLNRLKTAITGRVA